MKNTKKSYIVATIFCGLMLLCSIIFLGYTLLCCQNQTNQIFLILSSFILFIFSSIFAVGTLTVKTKVKNILMSIGAFIMSLFILFNILTIQNIIKLPMQAVLESLVNKNISEVLDWGKNHNIVINQTYEYSDTIDEFNIISQDVLPNTLLKNVKEITVTVSSGPNYDKQFVLQNLVGLNIDDALKITKENFMNNVEVTYEISDSITKDTIISQNINGQIKRNDLLKLVVSLGTKEDLVPVEMENLKNKSLFEATLWLNRYGIEYDLSYEFSNDIKRGYCISQSEKAGTTINPKENKITLVISKGKEISVPDFTTMNVTEATKWITENNLKIVFKEAYDNEIIKGNIISSNYKTNDKVETGTAIELVISKGNLKMEKFDNISAFRSWASALGLEYEENSEFSDSDIGSIISIEPSVGEAIDLNKKIKVTYSKGKSTKVPNFYNKSESEARKLCTNNNLKCYFTSKYSNSISSGYVMYQSMSKDSVVATGTSITLTLSKGKQPQAPVNTCTSTATHTLVIQPNWVTGGSANTTITTLKTKLANAYPKVKFNFTTKIGNNPSGYIHDDSPITSGSTIQDCKTYTIIINE